MKFKLQSDSAALLGTLAKMKEQPFPARLRGVSEWLAEAECPEVEEYLEQNFPDFPLPTLRNQWINHGRPQLGWHAAPCEGGIEVFDLSSL